VTDLSGRDTTNGEVLSPLTPMVWLWQRRPGSVELYKVRVPASFIGAHSLTALQRLYRTGDRVRFVEHGRERTGTVVLDQGIFVAVDADAPAVVDEGPHPGMHFTIPKRELHPLTATDVADAPPLRLLVPAASPHDPHELRTSAHEVSAHWDIGLSGDGWRRQAVITVAFVDRDGFLATLSAHEEHTHNGPRHERPSGVVDTVVYDYAARRNSKVGLRTTLATALDFVRAAYDADDRDIVEFFTHREATPKGYISTKDIGQK
jgi:hypothetical protein